MNTIPADARDTLAPALRAARSALGWSQQLLADRSGVSLPTIVRIERGHTSGRFTSVQRILFALEEAGAVLQIHHHGGFRLDLVPRLSSERDIMTP